MPSVLPAHLKRLEAESIHIMREVVAEMRNPVMLYSIGKDSSVMLHVAMKAFYPAKPPFPLLHVDTTWKFREMIAFRDETARRLGLELIVHINQDGVKRGISPIASGSPLHTQVMKTEALRQALDLWRLRRGFWRRAARRGKEPGQGAHLLASLGRAMPGIRATSGPNSGGCSTPGSAKANRCASFRSPTGPSSMSGNTSWPRTFPSCRSISPSSVPSSSATARSSWSTTNGCR